jgi:formate hydrogenlyase subunit 6/NADH:ubiquinone oxidoreductase subunit I
MPRYAFIGVRACELHAIKIQDKVFMGGAHQDPVYAGRRADNFIVAVNCGQAAKTCFCTSMNTGPKVGEDYDLCLTEIIDKDNHYFVAEAGTQKGAEVLADIPSRPAEKNDINAAAACTEKAEAAMGRAIDISDVKDLLTRNYDNARWDALEKRCLSCGNCTIACPTCFCSKVEDTTDLIGEHAQRWKSWDSCFTMDFSYIHGGSVRFSIKSRYRQWLTHKLATWFDQFGSSGCVGCGRCITWCPVGIDLTEEVKAIRESEKER